MIRSLYGECIQIDEETFEITGKMKLDGDGENERRMSEMLLATSISLAVSSINWLLPAAPQPPR